MGLVDRDRIFQNSDTRKNYPGPVWASIAMISQQGTFTVNEEKPKLAVLLLSTKDSQGGAEIIALEIFEALRMLGHDTRLLVGSKRSTDSDIIELPNDFYRSRWSKKWGRMSELLLPKGTGIKGIWRLNDLFFAIGQPKRWLGIYRGREDFDFPASNHLFDLLDMKPDIIHCHNLHGGYFDLRQIPKLSRQSPVILTLHDSWLLTGHCAHSFHCQGWKTGCGHCPDLDIYPSLRRDATRINLARKIAILGESSLYISSPSQWLMSKVRQSKLSPSVVDSKVIPNGVDLTVFRPTSTEEARRILHLPQDHYVLLFTATKAHVNRFKDYNTIKNSVIQVAKQLKHKKLVFIALGGGAPSFQVGNVVMHSIPHQADRKQIARYYQAADVYMHAALEETWGLSITEALACGVPVVTTNVGGIPEQILEGRTGFLVPPNDPGAMANAILTLLSNDSFRRDCGLRAAEDARKRFDVNRMVDDYLHWYHEILKSWNQIQEETHAVT